MLLPLAQLSIMVLFAVAGVLVGIAQTTVDRSCPYCKLSVSPRASKCPHCRCRLD